MNRPELKKCSASAIAGVLVQDARDVVGLIETLSTEIANVEAENRKLRNDNNSLLDDVFERDRKIKELEEHIATLQEMNASAREDMPVAVVNAEGGQ